MISVPACAAWSTADMLCSTGKTQAACWFRGFSTSKWFPNGTRWTMQMRVHETGARSSKVNLTTQLPIIRRYVNPLLLTRDAQPGSGRGPVSAKPSAMAEEETRAKENCPAGLAVGRAGIVRRKFSNSETGNDPLREHDFRPFPRPLASKCSGKSMLHKG